MFKSTNTEETKESIFRGIWHTLIKTMESFLDQFNEDEGRLSKIVNNALIDLTQNATLGTSARSYLERFIDEHHMKIGPDPTESMAIFKSMM